MATQLETFRIVAPELASLDDPTVLQGLSLAALQMNPDFFPVDVRGLALVYKAASMLTNRMRRGDTGGGAGGAVIMEKEGDLLRQYETVRDTRGRPMTNAYDALLDEITPKGGFILTRCA
ncbi:MAG: hypothetical protein ACTHKB_00675 [Burkholderiaceae bacterium]